MKSALSFLNCDSYQIYNRNVAKFLDSIYASIMLSELVNRFEYHNENGELLSHATHGEDLFYLTQEKCQERTCLSRKDQDYALKILKEKGFVKTFILGLPGKRYFKLDEDVILEAFGFKKNIARLSQSDKLDCPNRTNKDVSNGQTYIYKNPTEEPHKEQQQQAEHVVVVSSDKSEEAIKQIIDPIIFDSGVLKQISLLPIDQVKQAHAAYLQYAETHDLDNPSGFLRKAIVEAWKPQETKTKESEEDKQSKLKATVEAHKIIARKLLDKYKHLFTEKFSFSISDCVWFRFGSRSSPLGFSEENFPDMINQIVDKNIKY